MTEQAFPLLAKRVWVAGHRGMAGSALVRRLAMEGAEILAISRGGLDLRRQKDVEGWIAANRPDAIVLAALSGVEKAEGRPAQHLYDNMAIAQNVIDGAWRAGVDRLLLLNPGGAEPSSAPDASDIANFAGLKLVEAYRAQYGVRFISALPARLYGPGDRFEADAARLAPALMLSILRAKLARAPDVKLPYAPGAYYEFLHVGDLAEACARMLTAYDGAAPLAIGDGAPISIVRLASTIARVVDYRGRLGFDRARRDDAPRRPLDSSAIRNLGWRPEADIETGLRDAYFWLQSVQPELFSRENAA